MYEKGLFSAAEKFHNIKHRVDYQHNDYKPGGIRRLLKTGLEPAAEKTVYEYRQSGQRQYQPERSPVHVSRFLYLKSKNSQKRPAFHIF